MILRTLITVVTIVLLTCPTVQADYQPWSEDVFKYIEQEYGEKAEKRVRYLHTLILENQDLPVMEKLDLVNGTLNKLPWIADADHWKQNDYWALPIETIATFGGDCEDIAIVKWLVLSHLGISPEHLRLAYVRIKKTGENHMVLLYLERPDLPPAEQKVWVLDNYVAEVKRGAERQDLIAIYHTDSKGNLVLIRDNGKDRSIKGVYEERKMKKLDELKEKIAANMKILTELNGGRPILPAAR
jgi:predicted transglutaminase-like cysteine proteinase